MKVLNLLRLNIEKGLNDEFTFFQATNLTSQNARLKLTELIREKWELYELRTIQ